MNELRRRCFLPWLRYFNDVEVVDDEHFKLSHKEDEHLYRVDIVDVTEDHCGKIRVVAKNENGEDSKEVRRVDHIHVFAFPTLATQ